MDILKSGYIRNDQYKKCGFVRNFTVKKKTLIKIVGITLTNLLSTPEISGYDTCAAFLNVNILGNTKKFCPGKLVSFQIIMMCGCKKKAGRNFILFHPKHSFDPNTYIFYIQKYYIGDVKELIVRIHVAIKLHQKRIIRSDVFKTALGMSSKKLKEQTVILEFGC